LMECKQKYLLQYLQALRSVVLKSGMIFVITS
jgi:hypothetical protein